MERTWNRLGLLAVAAAVASCGGGSGDSGGGSGGAVCPAVSTVTAKSATVDTRVQAESLRQTGVLRLLPCSRARRSRCWPMP